MTHQKEGFKIRLANDTDFDQIFSIYLEGINKSFDIIDIDFGKIKEKFSSNFFQRQEIFNFWVAVDEEDRIIGWQSLIKTSNNPFRENTYAESSTYISSNNRYKGMGRVLLDHAIKEAEKSNLEYIIGFIEVSNEASRKITKETGWHTIGNIPESRKNKSKLIKTLIIRPV